MFTGPVGNGINVGSLAGRRAIITGGASGIGMSTAITLAQHGAEVIVTDVNEAGGAAVAEQVGGSFAMLDVGDPDAWDRVVATAGPFDIAFLNAGISTMQGLSPMQSHPIIDLPLDAHIGGSCRSTSTGSSTAPAPCCLA